METSIADLRANKQKASAPVPTQGAPVPTQAPTIQTQIPTPMAQPQMVNQMLPPMGLQQPAYNIQQQQQFPMDLSIYYAKMKDLGILLLLAMICFSTPFQDILVRNIPMFASTNTGKHTNMMGCLCISSILTSFFAIYKTFGNE